MATTGAPTGATGTKNAPSAPISDEQMDALIARRLDEQQRYGVTHRAAIVARSHERGHALASHDDATGATCLRMRVG